MARWEKLQSKLIELLETSNVYYQPPESLKMKYPCVRYSKSKPDVKHADDMKYINKDCYELTVIANSADDEMIDKILQLPYSSFDRHYVSNNLHHDVIILYY